jgi:aryl-alcohol dehydrogenase-like predicted oxidoreductase
VSSNDPLPGRTLGRSGLRVTPVGLGLAAVGRPAYITTGRDHDLGVRRSVAELEQRCHSLLDAAYAAGIRYVDAARSYGKAEQFLSTWLERRPDAAPLMTVGSKWGYRYVGEWRLDAEVHEIKDHSLAAFERQWAESAAVLDGSLDLYQIHSATMESGVLDDQSVLTALARLADSGVVVGLSVSGPHQARTIRRALEVEVDGVNPFSTVQATWNLLERSAGPALAEAHEAGWGVLVKEAVANGELSPSGSPPAAVADLADALGVGVDRIALAATLAQPWVDVVLSGATTEAQLWSNVSALDLRIDPNDLDRLEVSTEDPSSYWERRSVRPWR